jgi:CBS domain containing-hemolysin-like protein
MKKNVKYVHEEHSLEQALHAFIKTNQHMFIVVNSFEEYTGIITIEDILEQVIGHKITDEFDAYDDMRAVAADAARREHKAHKEQEAVHEAPSDDDGGETPSETDHEVVE